MEIINFIGSGLLAIFIFIAIVVACLIVRVVVSYAWIMASEWVDRRGSRKGIEEGL